MWPQPSQRKYFPRDHCAASRGRAHVAAVGLDAGPETRRHVGQADHDREVREIGAYRAARDGDRELRRWTMVISGQNPDTRFLTGPSVVLQEA